MEKPSFGLADIPEQWEIRLHDRLIEQLDRLNRPWAHDGSGRRHGDTVYWYRSTLRKRTLDRMTKEQKEYFYASYRLSERLWGTPKRKGKTFGPFIRKNMIPIIRKGVDISDPELERAVTGIKVSPSSDRILNCERLPIVANKYWAWFMGLYYSSGSIRFRDPATSTRATSESIEMPFKLHNPVLELGQEYAEEIGIYFRYFDRVQDRVIKPGKTKGMRTGRLSRAGLGWPEYRILEKFGMSNYYKVDQPKVTARYWKQVIPEWIKQDDECMTMFVAGLLNGSYGVSSISRAGARKKNLALSVCLRITGLPEEYIKKFAEDLRDWFITQELRPSFRQMHSGYASKLRGKYIYEVSLNNWDSVWFLLTEMTIVRPDLRARLMAKVQASQDPFFNEAMIQLRSPHNVVLSMLTEGPMTANELDWSLQVKREGIIDVLRSLQMRGLIVKRKDAYHYDSSKFQELELRRKEGYIETLSKRALRYSTRLLYKCAECGKVYVTDREACGMCGGILEPTPRITVLQSIHQQRSHALLRYRKLVKENGKCKENESDEY